ncbi:MAG: hypothetical protein ACYS26_03405 [Planctomycetota bacterium]
MLLVALAGGGWWLLGEPSVPGTAAERDAALESEASSGGEALSTGGARPGAMDPSEGARSAVAAEPKADLEVGATPSPFRVRVVDEGPGQRLSAPRVEFLDGTGAVVSLGVGDEAPWPSAERAPDATTPSKGWHVGEPRWDRDALAWILPALPDHTFSLFVRDSVSGEFATGLEGELTRFGYDQGDSRTVPIRVDRPEPLVFHGFHFGRGLVNVFLDGPNHLPSLNSRIPIGPGPNEFTDRVHALGVGTTRLVVEVVGAASGQPVPDVGVTVLRDETDAIDHVEFGWDVRPTDRVLAAGDWRVWPGTQETNAQGRVELPVEAPGRYRIALHGEAHADSLGDAFHVPLADSLTQRVELPAAATLFGEITVDAAAAEDLKLMQLQALGLSGAAFDYSLDLSDGQDLFELQAPSTNLNRSYSFEGLAPGTYRYLLTGYPDPARANLFELRLRTGEVTLRAGEAHRLDLHVDGAPDPGAASAGVVVRGTWTPDFDGRARPEAVMLLALEGGPGSDIRSPLTRAIAGAVGVDEQGRFEMEAIQPGRYLLMGQGSLETSGAEPSSNREQLMASLELEVADADLDVSLHSGPRVVRFLRAAGGSDPASKVHPALGAPEGPAWLDSLLRSGSMGVAPGGEFALYGLPDRPLLMVFQGDERPLEDIREVVIELD